MEPNHPPQQGEPSRVPGPFRVHVSFCVLGGGVDNVNRRFCGLSVN